MDIIDKARGRMMLNHPFFAHLLLTSNMHRVKTLPGLSGQVTAATDGKQVYVNPDFFNDKKLIANVAQAMTVLAHEAQHMAYMHPDRGRGRVIQVWRWATDFAVNRMLKEQRFEEPACGWLWDDKYADWQVWSAEKIYEDLLEQCEAQGGSGDGQSGGRQLPGRYRDGLGDDLARPAPKSPAEAAADRQEMREKVAQAAQMARSAGKLSGELAALVGDILEPKVPWYDLLRDYMLQNARDDETWNRRNRRFQGVYLPTRHSERMGPMVFCADTSGSMWGSDKDLQRVCSEMAHCAELLQPSEIRVVWADVAVHGEQVFEAGEFEHKRLKPMGGGGTDMRIVLKHVEHHDPMVVVLLTDGETPWPDREPPFPLITICTTGAKVPWGRVVRI